VVCFQNFQSPAVLDPHAYKGGFRLPQVVSEAAILPGVGYKPIAASISDPFTILPRIDGPTLPLSLSDGATPLSLHS